MIGAMSLVNVGRKTVCATGADQHFLVAVASADWYCRVASKSEGQQQAVVAETARRLSHFQEHSRRNAVRKRASCKSKRQGRSTGLAREANSN